ncbi:hypothetical protein SteCoe_35892 [Stentor coeruleus]|uniref:UNC-50 family protein n=1 Tax=Stentor coeruleus TaxID=5963 RepID=A0A1R2ARA9_9CILI|nr:hypothetical protein SteCoe_35892 [Stentor coeruleus]
MEGNWFRSYFRRARNMRQMDINSTFCQMMYICFSPHKLTKTTTMRKTIKHHWSRDDPAFAVMLIAGLGIASLAYAIALTNEGFYGLIKALFSSIVVHFLILGCAIAYINYRVIENHMIKEEIKYSGAGSKVEWLYCFDVHCNSFLPVFLMCYVLQYFLLPVLLYENFISVLISALLNVSALSYYFYITSQGFSALPFLKNTEYFLVPIAGVFLIGIVAVIFRVNITKLIITLHF